MGHPTGAQADTCLGADGVEMGDEAGAQAGACLGADGVEMGDEAGARTGESVGAERMADREEEGVGWPFGAWEPGYGSAGCPPHPGRRRRRPRTTPAAPNRPAH